MSRARRRYGFAAVRCAYLYHGSAISTRHPSSSISSMTKQQVSALPPPTCGQGLATRFPFTIHAEKARAPPMNFFQRLLHQSRVLCSVGWVTSISCSRVVEGVVAPSGWWQRTAQLRVILNSAIISWPCPYNSIIPPASGSVPAFLSTSSPLSLSRCGNAHVPSLEQCPSQRFIEIGTSRFFENSADSLP